MARDCYHRARLDLKDLAARLGPELPLADLVARSVSSECGARWPRISISIAVDNAPWVVPDRAKE
jgi:hypothetical protein